MTTDQDPLSTNTSSQTQHQTNEGDKDEVQDQTPFKGGEEDEATKEERGDEEGDEAKDEPEAEELEEEELEEEELEEEELEEEYTITEILASKNKGDTDFQLSINTDLANGMQEVFKKTGIRKDQAEQVISVYTDILRKQQQAREQAEYKQAEKAKKILTAEWGEDVEENLNLVDRAIIDLSKTKQGKTDLRRARVFNGDAIANATLAQLLVAYGRDLTGDRVESSRTTGNTDIKRLTTVEACDNLLKKIRNTKDFMMGDKDTLKIVSDIHLQKTQLGDN